MSSAATTVAQSQQPQPVPPAETPPKTGRPEDGAAPRQAPDYSSYRVVAAKHPWRWVGTAVVALGVLAVAWSLATNPRWEWGVVAQWFTAQSIVTCPVCGSEMRPEYGQRTRALFGRCTDCGSTLA